MARLTISSLPCGHAERAAYIAKGRVEVDGHSYEAGRMLVFTRVRALGGQPQSLLNNDRTNDADP
ncbi:hypothetical protein [Microvirga massiliensis]|uniref:hypothetical protein n=1 Tax=Microvirga massiliensis TaxID=1033741 RepID=UPI00062B3153|nr:hypothetical protein [Microvirga massiliensis]